MNKIINDNLDKIRALCTKHEVKNLFVFGSASTEEFNSASDIDLLVSFKPIPLKGYADNYFTMIREFEEIFKRPVDLITEKYIKNPYFSESVNKTKVLLYGKEHQ